MNINFTKLLFNNYSIETSCVQTALLPQRILKVTFAAHKQLNPPIYAQRKIKTPFSNIFKTFNKMQSILQKSTFRLLLLGVVCFLSFTYLSARSYRGHVWVYHHVLPAIAPTVSVSIAASATTIYAGTSVTFTATPTNGGTSPTYQWKNGNTDVGTNSDTYISTTLANGDIISCMLTSSLTNVSPTTATSTGITMSVVSAYTWTGNTSTDWATATNWTPNGTPLSTQNVIIPTTTNKPMLPTNQTIANLSLTGTNKVMLGNNTLSVNTITGGSASTYVITDGTGSLIIKALPTNVPTIFPIGASTTNYAPLSIQPTNSVDFTVKVKTTANAAGFSGTIANFAKVVPLQWDITPSASAGATILALTNGGTTYLPITPKVGHYTSGNIWVELTATHNNGTWTTTTTSFSPFGIGDAGGFVVTLPVELLAFTATPSVKGNLLTWTTASEVNNKGFKVERAPQPSKGAFDAWEVLGFVNAKGKAATYDFTDATPPLGSGAAYYRLRQMDNDGKETLSKVVSVSTKSNNKLKVYPNPVSNILTVETIAQGDFQILNLLGQQVLTGKKPPLGVGGIDVSALPQGTYFLKVGEEQVKFVKQ